MTRVHAESCLAVDSALSYIALGRGLATAGALKR